MKTAVLGAGVLGSVIGGLMAAAGRDVSLWDLNEAHLAAVCENGLRLDEVVDQIHRGLEHHTEHKPSMLQDIEAGWPTEISSLCGEVARLAEQHNVHAPLNAVLAALIDLRSRVTDQHASTT